MCPDLMSKSRSRWCPLLGLLSCELGFGQIQSQKAPWMERKTLGSAVGGGSMSVLKGGEGRWCFCTKISSLSKVGNVEFILLINCNLLWSMTQDTVETNEYLVILFGNNTGLWVRSLRPGPDLTAICAALGKPIQISLAHLSPCEVDLIIQNP